jgi:hypothetical protein
MWQGLMARKAIVVPKDKFVVFVVIGHIMMPQLKKFNIV